MLDPTECWNGLERFDARWIVKFHFTRIIPAIMIQKFLEESQNYVGWYRIALELDLDLLHLWMTSSEFFLERKF